jgi:hypothetical protein
VEVNSTGGQGSRRAVVPSGDDDDDECLGAYSTQQDAKTNGSKPRT